MKIKRNVNGQEMEFELTSEEVLYAFYEQDKEFHKEDIQSILEKRGLSVSDEELEYIVDKYKDYLSEDDSWRYSAEAAIDDAIEN